MPISDRFIRLSRTIAHALRHRPERYGLQLDENGWVSLDTLVRAIAREPQWAGLRKADVLAMMAAAEKRRYEVCGLNIRAFYGHSLADKIKRQAEVPPDLLYHGTTPGAAERIRRDGLKPMRRHYVHLSLDAGMAASIARRRTAAPIVIVVNAKEAHEDGIAFHFGNDQVWLAERIAVRYLSFPRACRILIDSGFPYRRKSDSRFLPEEEAGGDGEALFDGFARAGDGSRGGGRKHGSGGGGA